MNFVGNNRLPEILRGQAMSLVNDPVIVQVNVEKHAFQFAGHMRDAILTVNEMIDWLVQQSPIARASYLDARQEIERRDEQHRLETGMLGSPNFCGSRSAITASELDSQFRVRNVETDYALRAARNLSGFFNSGNYAAGLARENLECEGVSRPDLERSTIAGKILMHVIQFGEAIRHPQNAINSFFSHFNESARERRAPLGFRHAQFVMKSLRDAGGSMIDIKDGIPEGKARDFAKFLSETGPELMIPMATAPTSMPARFTKAALVAA